MVEVTLVTSFGFIGTSGQRSGGRLATILVATKNTLFSFFSFEFSKENLSNPKHKSLLMILNIEYFSGILLAVK